MHLENWAVRTSVTEAQYEATSVCQSSVEEAQHHFISNTNLLMASPRSMPTHGKVVAAEKRKDVMPEKQWHEAGAVPTTQCPLRSSEVGWNCFNGWLVINTCAYKQSMGINQAWNWHFIRVHTAHAHECINPRRSRMRHTGYHIQAFVL